jgi:hypothetical protein
MTQQHEQLEQGKYYLIHHKIGSSCQLMEVLAKEVSQRAYYLYFVDINKAQWIEKRRFDSFGFSDSEYSVYEELELNK